MVRLCSGFKIDLYERFVNQSLQEQCSILIILSLTSREELKGVSLNFDSDDIVRVSRVFNVWQILVFRVSIYFDDV